MDGGKKYWLLKTEVGEWSWEDQAANGGISKWDGVKNKQAQKNMKSMRVGDLCFFYHSGPKARRIVGVVSVIREWYMYSCEGQGSKKGGKDEEAGAVDVKAVGEMRRPVDLKEMKADDGLEKGFALFKQPRLSVVPVPNHVWDRLCEIGGGYEPAAVATADDGADIEDE
ncbi:thymocyte nuclear protein 1 isoform X1 [Macadamia integrifolia]|uniref:thymocyte nuclear protein 1 isoform X1 n=1 Tax=Macadamia integrifolia TaxID=60698 RepID=UPI001C5023E3|nr:thymocyte nuclear protein 1 isoform X1 [Macadamia integrifolia]